MPIPVLSVARMREWEAATWAAGQTEAEVIRRVGRCLARCMQRLTRPGDRILVLAGKGHNGDDARAALAPEEGDSASGLRKANGDSLPNRKIDLLNVSDPAVELPTLRKLLKNPPALIVDALFGIGLNRALNPEWVSFIRTVNESSSAVLSVDVPSGLNADTGEHFGAVIEADVTLTVGAPKSGMFVPGALPAVGRLEVANDVGLLGSWSATAAETSELLCTDPQEFNSFPPRRSCTTHKGTYGHLAIVAGSVGYHGAAVLAARGAQRAQPGLITLFASEGSYAPIASQLQAVMVAPWRVPPKLPADYDCVMIGPGLAAPELRNSLSLLTRHVWCGAECPLVVDASGLDWVPLESPARNAVRVLTPHPGEAARMLRSPVSRVEADRPAALRALSHRYGNAWVVLKGHQTLIGRSTGAVCVNLSGNPHLSQGGSGDLLAGFLAGLLAQKHLRADLPRLLAYAVWQHGACADRLQQRRPNWTLEDLAAELGLADPAEL